LFEEKKHINAFCMQAVNENTGLILRAKGRVS